VEITITQQVIKLALVTLISDAEQGISKDLKNWKNVKNQVPLIGNQVFCRTF
jgi:hypothetical protein